MIPPGRRLAWSAPLAVGGAVVATLVVRGVARLVLDIPDEFLPLAEPGPTIFLTTVGASGGVAVFAAFRRFAALPDRTFRRVALVALLLSFVPDIWLFTEGGREAFAGATVQAVSTLMVQHVVAAIVVVISLTGWRTSD